MDSRVFYGTLVSMSMTFMDSISMVTIQDSRPTTDESRGSHRIGAKGSPTSEAMRKLSFAPCTTKLLLTGRLVPFIRRLGLNSTILCLRGYY